MSSESRKGIGFTEILTIVFIVLRLTKVIDWSWWWVFSPILISIVITILYGILQAIVEDKKAEENNLFTRLQKMQEEKEELEKRMKNGK